MNHLMKAPVLIDINYTMSCMSYANYRDKLRGGWLSSASAP